LADADLSQLDPHRPYVDDVVFPCPDCSDEARRVPEVIDAWYDSGSMPFAQFGYPHVEGSAELFKERFPADFICEAIDQTRGWFYSLMAVSTLLFEGPNSYRTVLCLGHIVDADGRKMSKSLGNILDPWELVDTRGADALRWLLLTEGSPWVSRRVSTELLDEVIRKFLLTVWNTYYFFVTYARIDGWTPESSKAAPASERPVMDRWILAELAAVVAAVDTSLDDFDTTGAGRAISGFVDDLSNWYVRRSRGRFWAETTSDVVAADKDAAFATLHECLVTVAALMAPLTPFIADELYENLVLQVDTGAPDSVHLLDFPVPDQSAVDEDLRAAMRAARRVVELGRRARNDARVGVRQPLHRALVTLPSEARASWNTVAGVVASELNVKAMELGEGREGTVTYRVKPNFRALGPTFGKRTPVVAKAVEAADGAVIASELAETGTASVDVEGEEVTVTAEQVQVIEESQTGWQSASDGPYGVALDLAIDDALRREGLAREAVRGLNDLRKRRDLALSDRVHLRIGASGEAAEALREHAGTIRSEVLAVSLDLGEDIDGERVELSDGVVLDVVMEVVTG
jgi:isoleucyl-tRNA synthetase